METLSSSVLQKYHPKSTSSSIIVSNINGHKILNHFIRFKSSLTTTNQLLESLTTLKIPQYPTKEAITQNEKKQSILTTFLNKLDDFICNFIDLPLHPVFDPEHVLSGNKAPVDELPPTACDAVEGSLPSCLDGAYIRNGPNPQFSPKRRPYYFLDGDGMLHMIRISEGKATFCSRYVSTHKHAVERDVGYPFVPSIFSSFNGGIAASIARLAVTIARVVTGQFDPANCGTGVANTSLAVIGRRLFALCESDLPYAIKVTPEGDVITLGRHDFRASEPFPRMTAHPKVDRLTGEAFVYGYNIVRPFLTFSRINSEGKKLKDVPIFSMGGFSAIHDFGVTKNYAVFPDTQIVAKLWWILKGRSPIGFSADKTPRLGIIRKDAEDGREMWWIDTPGFNMLHCVNAWEEDGGATVKMVASNMVSVEKMFESVDQSRLTLEMITINVEEKEKKVERRPVSSIALDFGVINPAFSSKKCRYVYAGVMGEKTWVGVVKLDLSMSEADGGDCTVASRFYGPGCYGGEPFFVAREPDNPVAEEDDGYLVTYVHDENAEQSRFFVMDAKSPTLDVIAAVKLPQRVPDGFHGIFLSENELNTLI